MKTLNALFAPLYFVYKLWIGVVFWCSLIVLYPFFWILLQRSQWHRAAFQLKRFWSKCFQLFLFCPVHAVFSEKLPKPPYIIVSNHSSYLDTVFMYSVFSDYFLFIGKGELLKWPLFRLFFKKQDIPVQREKGREAWKSLQKAYEALDQGACVAIYPEGTIPDSAPRMRPFKNGAFKMAIDKNVPIVPVTWLQNHRIMKDPAKLWEYSLPAQVLVHVHAPIFPSGTTDEDLVTLRRQVFESIDGALPPAYRHQSRPNSAPHYTSEPTSV
jgi:1-acyl-sn-glycerol-3-phosphate acyltransferase